MKQVMRGIGKASVAVLLIAVITIAAAGLEQSAHAAARPAAPKNVQVSTPLNKGKKATVRLKWSRVKGAKAYKVYVSGKKDGKYKLVKKVKKAAFKKKYPTSKNCFFKVSAVKGRAEGELSLYAAVRPGKPAYNCHYISIDEITTLVTEGKTRNLKLTGDGKLLSKYGFRYKSSRPSVASIVGAKKTSAKIKAHKAGTTTITVIAPNGMYTSKKVTVTKKSSSGGTKTETRTDGKGNISGTVEVDVETYETGEKGDKPGNVTVPDVLGIDYKKAEKILIDAGLAYKVTINVYTEKQYEEKFGDAEPGRVLTMKIMGSDGKTQEDVSAGTELPWGTCVYLTTAKKAPKQS